MICWQWQSCCQKKERVDKRHPTTANKKMECPSSFFLAGRRLAVKNIAMGKMSTQQTQKPATNQHNIYTTGNTNFGGAGFG